LQQLQADHSDICSLHIIGYSTLDHIPIYALKISDHPDLEEAEPAVLFLGQVHAEEVLGVETTMRNINEILDNSGNPPYGNWIAQLEMWFIPTINPEGHNVVTDGLDPSYRKNKFDANHNGIFDFSTMVGYDIDGVDINRNFDTNWVHGDTLYTPPSPSAEEAYDYYRGEAPFDQSESQALKAFCDVQKPVFCIVWHSSRNDSSNLFEGVFYPLNWYGVRPAPDLDLGTQIGVGVAGQIVKQDGANTYEKSASSARKGDINTYLYKQYGTICLVIECGTTDLQPIEATMLQITQRCSEGVKWLLNRALPVSDAVPSNSMLTGLIKDAVTNLPLEAEVRVMQKDAPWFAPRKSDPILGKYWRPIFWGNYEIHYIKKGYFDYIRPNQIVNDGSWTVAPVVLMQPRPAATISGSVRNSNNQVIPAHIVLYDVENDTLSTNGDFILSTFVGSHRIEISSEGFYPYIDTLEIATGVQHLNLNVVLSPITPVFTEGWENGTSNWTISAPHTWVVENELAANGHAITDSWGGKGFYAENCNVWIKTNNPITIPTAGHQILTFDEHLYTEFVYDSVRVEVSSDNSLWQTIYSKTGKFDYWHPVYIGLDEFAGQTMYFRFRLTDISSNADLTDPGWTIDNIKIFSGSATPTSDETVVTMPMTVLYPNYPNPFNPETNIKFSNTLDGKVAIEIYNLKGQKVKQITNEQFKSGTHTLKWNGKDDNGKAVSSGIYFCKMQSNNKTQTLKMVLMK
jgi:hypothetical protein